jgi:hypothetical protein
MKYLCFLLAGIMSVPSFAGDLWETTSISVSTDGTTVPYSRIICFPKGSVDPAQMLGGIGNCATVQKSGKASAMTFTMTCKTAGMPPEMAGMKVIGDASLNDDMFDMRFLIPASVNQGSEGEDFKMSGTAEAHKIGHCDAL